MDINVQKLNNWIKTEKILYASCNVNHKERYYGDRSCTSLRIYTHLNGKISIEIREMLSDGKWEDQTKIIYCDTPEIAVEEYTNLGGDLF